MNKKEISKSYYTNTKRKIVDFLMGFFIAVFFIIIIDFVSPYLNDIYYFIQHGQSDPFANTCFAYDVEYKIFKIITTIIFTILLLLFLKNKRYFIVFGIITILFLSLFSSFVLTI